MKYILDTNVYIAAYNNYYNPNICSSYWDVLKELGNSEKIKSPKQVKEEITIKDDRLSKWTKKDNKCFISTDLGGISDFFLQVATVYSEIKNKHVTVWKEKFAENNKSYSLRTEPISDEDMFVVATALFYQHHFPNQPVTLVTKEILKNNPQKPVRIPHLCRELKIRWMNDFDFIKEVGITFDAQIKFPKKFE